MDEDRHAVQVQDRRDDRVQARECTRQRPQREAIRHHRIAETQGCAASRHAELQQPFDRGPAVADLQASALPDARPAWHDTTDTLPEGPLIVIANEFFDALPIHQYVRQSDGWHERLVAIGLGKSLCFETATSATEALTATPGAPGDIIERAPARDAVMDTLCQRIDRNTGAALVIDYGPAKSAPGDTLQAVRAHQPVSVFEAPGECDLTSHVHFDHLAALIAPRPFLDIRATGDQIFYNIEEIRDAETDLGALYDLCGMRERYRSIWFEGPHAYTATAARETQAWLYRWLWDSCR